MVDAQQSGELKNRAVLSLDEVNTVCFLLRDQLKDSDVIVSGLVTYSWEKTRSENCPLCGSFTLSEKIFNSVKEFVTFWGTFVEEHILRSQKNI